MKTKLNTIALAAIIAATLTQLTGCATAPNGFSQFYQDRSGAGVTNLPPYTGQTKILTPSNPTNDVKELFRSGYTLIGEAAFQGPPQAKNALMSQAKKVGADVVLYSCEYLGSEQVSVPRIQYEPGQTYTTRSSGTISANSFGSEGYIHGNGNYYGTSTTTTPGTFSTQVVPVTVHRYQYDAGFFRKTKPRIFGALTQPLPSELRQQLQRNTGVYVWIIRNGSPAFNANILEGDVILKLNGEDATSVENFTSKLIQLAGQKVEVEIWRNGQTEIIPVQLSKAP